MKLVCWNALFSQISHLRNCIKRPNTIRLFYDIKCTCIHTHTFTLRETFEHIRTHEWNCELMVFHCWDWLNLGGGGEIIYMSFSQDGDILDYTLYISQFQTLTHLCRSIIIKSFHNMRQLRQLSLRILNLTCILWYTPCDHVTITAHTIRLTSRYKFMYLLTSHARSWFSLDLCAPPKHEYNSPFIRLCPRHLLHLALLSFTYFTSHTTLDVVLMHHHRLNLLFFTINVAPCITTLSTSYFSQSL